ncbi:MAG: hypothetical protein ACXWNH_20340 [Vulcanimicrobiaceae bacterium]
MQIVRALEGQTTGDRGASPEQGGCFVDECADLLDGTIEILKPHGHRFSGKIEQPCDDLRFAFQQLAAGEGIESALQFGTPTDDEPFQPALTSP